MLEIDSVINFVPVFNIPIHQDDYERFFSVSTMVSGKKNDNLYYQCRWRLTKLSDIPLLCQTSSEVAGFFVNKIG